MVLGASDDPVRSMKEMFVNQAHFAHWPEGVPFKLPDLPVSPHASLVAAAAKRRDAVALNYYGAEISYGTLVAEVERMARGLIKRGVAPGDRVLLCLQNSPQYVISYYAVSAAGAVVVPVNPMNREDEIAYLVEDTGAAAIVAGAEKWDDIGASAERIGTVVLARYRDYLPAHPEGNVPEVVYAQLPSPLPDNVLTWDGVMANPAGGTLPRPAPDAPVVMPYTSGTTGRPKGCVHSNRSMMSTAVASSIWLGFDAGTVQLVSLPLFHVTGMQICMVAGLMTGGTLHLMTRWDRDLAIELIERHRITTWIAIAAMVVDVVNTPGLERRDLSALSKIMGGGAAMPEAVAARLKDLTGLDYIEGYGLSETAAPVMINPPSRPKRACLGIPLMEVDARIVDPETGTELGPNERGEIVVNAPQVFSGYWQRPEATEEAFLTLDGRRFFRTGDLGHRDEDGYFHMTDRLKRMINAAGYKVWPTEVEGVLFGHPAIREVCIISYPDDRVGEAVKAVVVRNGSQDTLTEEDIVEWCHQKMSAYKVPRRVEFADALPRSGTGKVLWRELQEKEWG